MGTPPVTTMRVTLALALLTLAGLQLVTVCEGYAIDWNPINVDRRGYRDPDDPRNLFAAMYGANYKRSDPAMQSLTPEMMDYLKGLVHKRGRGLRDPYDPRNLFHSIYGGIFRRRFFILWILRVLD